MLTSDERAWLEAMVREVVRKELDEFCARKKKERKELVEWISKSPSVGSEKMVKVLSGVKECDEHASEGDA